MKEKIKLEILFPGNCLIQFFKRGSLKMLINRAESQLDYFDQIYYLSFGGPEELGLLTNSRLKVLNNKAEINKYLYFLIFPFIHFKDLREVTLFESRQMPQAILGVLLKFLFKKPLVVKCDYDWIEFADRDGRFWLRILARIISFLGYRYSDFLHVTSHRQITKIKEFNVPNSRIMYHPNSKSIRTFHPGKEKRIPGKIITVARLEKQKNLENLIKALHDFPIDYELHIFGIGTLRERLENLASRLNINIIFHGTVSTKDLVYHLRTCQVFILPSLWEGNANAIVEAIGCGAPVIVSSIEANTEIIKDGFNGLVTGTEPEEIRKDIMDLLKDEQLQEKLSKNAFKTFEKTFSIENNRIRLIKKFKSIIEGD